MQDLSVIHDLADHLQEVQDLSFIHGPAILQEVRDLSVIHGLADHLQVVQDLSVIHILANHVQEVQDLSVIHGPANHLQEVQDLSVIHGPANHRQVVAFVPHPLGVQEGNVSIPQFCRIRKYFVVCWTANGWITCSRFMRCVVIEVLRSTNETKTPTSPASGNRCETEDRSRNTPETKLKGNRDFERCHIWTTFLRTHILLLKASLSCTI